ncbi:MAG: hypothetical protein R2912_10255 [Eubacteriales bacterium]
MNPVRMTVLGAGASWAWTRTRLMRCLSLTSSRLLQSRNRARHAEPPCRALMAYPNTPSLLTGGDALAAGIEADAVLVATQDNQHVEPACVSWSADTTCCSKTNRHTRTNSSASMIPACMYARAAVCHVLRYTRFFNTLKAIIDSGEIANLTTSRTAKTWGIGTWRTALCAEPAQGG